MSNISLTDLRELRIGNYVQRTWDKQIFVISYLKDGYDPMVKNLEGKIMPSDSYEGIPISEEWLERFGFTEEIASPYSDQPAYCIFEDAKMLIYSSGDLFKRSSYTSYIRITNWSEPPRQHRINFVHELQNLIHALTGTELTLKQ